MPHFFRRSVPPAASLLRRTGGDHGHEDRRTIVAPAVALGVTFSDAIKKMLYLLGIRF